MSTQTGQQQGVQTGAGQAPPQNGPQQQTANHLQFPPATGPQAGQQQAGNQGNTENQGQAPGNFPQNGQQQAPNSGQEPQDVASLPQWAQNLIQSTRAEAGSARTQAKEQAAQEAKTEFAQKIAAALGITPEGQAPDPAALQSQIVEREGQLRRERIENAAYRRAAGLGANPDLLLDSNAFLTAVHQLDPTAADFATRLDAVVSSAVTTNPLLKAGTQPGAAPPPFAPNPGQQAGNGNPPAPSTVSAGAALYQSRHQKTN
jgi:hypothetical protein